MNASSRREIIRNLVNQIYGEEQGRVVFDRICELLDKYPAGKALHPSSQLSEQDVVLITYGDQLRDGDQLRSGDQLRQTGSTPLGTLTEFCNTYLQGMISTLHLLPFFPYSSDDGFSVIDYRAVDPELGSWDDVAHLGLSFHLMFDAVINHISVESHWFQEFLKGNPSYLDYFIVVEGDPDLSQVVRPRALPLLTEFRTASGVKQVWTTFSADQVDLNYHNPQILLEIIDLLLFYAEKGAGWIRLDAIAYLWKEIGTPCIHLPETHLIIQLFRSILEESGRPVLLVTETNVPHQENLSYFGDGSNEAHLVYNFALPPLVLHTILTGDAANLFQWAGALRLPSPQVTFFNFLASHDGIGLNPARGILPDEAIDKLVEKTLAHGGLVSYKSNPDGTQSAYELNINYFDALSDPSGERIKVSDALSNPEADLPIDKQVDRFVAAHAIMLSLIGVPGIYFHSLFGSRGWREGVKLTGRSRSINRQKLERAELERELSASGGRRKLVFERFKNLLRARSSSPAFHPLGSQKVIQLGEGIFSVLRSSPNHEGRVLCLQNVTGGPRRVRVDPAEIGFLLPKDGRLMDIIGRNYVALEPPEELLLMPYQTLWLEIPKYSHRNSGRSRAY